MCWHHGKIEFHVIEAKGNANERFLPNNIFRGLTGRGENMEVNAILVQSLIAIGGLVKHALGEKMAYQYKVNYLFEDIDRSDIDKNRKAEGLENLALSLFGEEIKGDVK